MLSAIRSYLLPIIKLYLLGLKVLLVQLFSRSFRLPVMPRQDGKVAIVTGGGRGIGYEVVRHMARLGLMVPQSVLGLVSPSCAAVTQGEVKRLFRLRRGQLTDGGRDEQEGLTAVRRICEEYKEAKVEFTNWT
ncbi:hypothetical protein PFLUV_G00143560 [Perca fluviatilis]|uniref:Uncharacterized protein n=1 Tax=Perca fluviatilis TaxID=8168 RepID=A0A6A5EJA8_PERFL|nr:hypothetical protein PFLUV_G00143560 [Perca fluviatilis]